MAKILVIGSANTDMVIRTQKFPSPGETILGGDFFMFSGGKGANQAVAAARLGGAVCFIGNLGQDIFGQRISDQLKQEGIDTQFLTTDPSRPSGIALILVNQSGENEIVVASGANLGFTDQLIQSATSAIATAEIILVQLEIPVPAVLLAAQIAHGQQKKLLLNPAPAQSLPQDLYPLLYLITPNETEAEILTGIPVSDLISAAKAAQKLLDLGVQHVIITLGAKGAFFKDRHTEFLVEAPIVTAVDTTAAGDVFNGALAVALSSGEDWPAAISKACHAASLSVTKMGAQASMPYLAEIS